MWIASFMQSAVSSILAVVLALGPAEFISDGEAKRLFAEGQQAYSTQDYATAAQSFEAAYDIEPAPELLYAWAQAVRSGGDCSKAIDLYERLLDEQPGEKLAVAAEQNINRCQEQLADEAAAAAEPDETDEPGETETEGLEDDEDTDIVDEALAEAPPPETKAEPEPIDQSPTKKWYQDPVGGVLVGLGVAGIGVGAGLTGLGTSRAKSAADVDTNSAYVDERDRATTFRNAGVATLTIGGALLVAGVIRYALVARKNKQQTAAVWLSPDSAGLTWTGRF